MNAENPDSFIDWDKVYDFTPEMYALYETAPIWELDGFRGEKSYESHWCQLADQLVMSSKAAIGRWQKNGKTAAKAVEQYQQGGGDTPIFSFEGALAQEPLPIAISMVHEKVALLAANPPRPTISPKQESQIPYCAALQSLLEMTLEGNDYNTVVADAYYDIQFWSTAILKWVIDLFEPGLFAEPGRVTLEKCCPTEIFFDPEAKKLDCRYMDYVIQKHEFEIGEIQQKWPLSARNVRAEIDRRISDTNVTSKSDDYIQSPVPKMARDNPGRVQKIQVLEMWIRDSRLKFEPLIVDGESPDYAKRFKLDRDGYIMGNWVKRYPNGRLIICTAETILKDIPNPLPHGQFPYVFCRGMPSSTAISVGNAPRIMTVTRKINNVIGDVHKYYQSEIKRPMHSSPGAVNDPNLAGNVPNDPSYIIELNGPAASLVRPPAQDIPQGVFPYLQFLQGTVDLTSGSSGLMRGKLEEADQISVDAMSQLQNFASSRLALEASFFNVSMKQLFYQGVWILRALVKSDMKVQVTLPNGQQDTVDWKSDRAIFAEGDPTKIQQLRAKEDYLVGIKAGSGAPGAQQQQRAMAQSLFNDRLIDRLACLDMLQIDKRQEIDDRMRKAELEDLEAKGIAKELGVNINEQIKQERAGRRPKV